MPHTNTIELPQMSEETATEILDHIKESEPIKGTAGLITLFQHTDPDILFDYVKIILTEGGLNKEATSALKTILVETFSLVKRFITPEEFNYVVFLLNTPGDTEYKEAIHNKYKQSQKENIDPDLVTLIYSIRYECYVYNEEASPQRWRLFGMIDNGFTIAGDHVDIATKTIESTSGIITSLATYLTELAVNNTKESTEQDQDNRVDTIRKNIENFNEVLIDITQLWKGRLSDGINLKIEDFTKQWIKKNQPKKKDDLESLLKKLAEIAGKKID